MTARFGDERVPARWWRKLEASASGCWLWTGPVTHHGYGRAQNNGKRQVVHRAVYELLVGPVAEGLELDHLCRVRNCVRPDHLEPVTHLENMSRGAHAQKQVCLRGHALVGDNVAIRDGHHRECRTCISLRRSTPEAIEKRKAQQREYYKKSQADPELHARRLAAKTKCNRKMRERRVRGEAA